LRRFALGNVFYLATIGLSFVNATLTLAVHGALAIYYCFDQLPGVGTAAADDRGTTEGDDVRDIAG
jgi:hypothetical protein